jgi:hypothetical protein
VKYLGTTLTRLVSIIRCDSEVECVPCYIFNLCRPIDGPNSFTDELISTNGLIAYYLDMHVQLQTFSLVTAEYQRPKPIHMFAFLIQFPPFRTVINIVAIVFDDL